MKQCDCRLIGLTGSIATGKSTVSNMLMKRGYKVIDADIISRKVVEVGKPAYHDIVNAFGVDILLNNYANRNILNKIVHPRVFSQLKREILENCSDNQIIFIDIPLLFEVIDQIIGNGIEFEEIWLVYSDLKNQLIRLMKRDKIDKIQAMKRINSQMDIEEKRVKSTKTLYNNGDLVELERNLDLMLDELKG